VYNLCLDNIILYKSTPLGAIPIILVASIQVKQFSKNKERTNVKIFYFCLEIETSIVETFLVLPSWDLINSEPMFTGPILYPSVSILFTMICATSTALVILLPLAFMITVGSFASCTKVAVT
jgi:hypothetical protein